MKKILALALAMLMIMALAVPAAAYDITINESKSGHTYEAYQIFSGEISGGVLTNIEWGAGIDGDAFLAALLADETEISNADGSVTITFKEAFGVNADYTTACATAEDVATRIKAWTDNGDRMQHFARMAAEYLTTPSKTATDADGYKLTGLDAGYYLIKDKAYGSDADPLPDDFYTDIILSVVTNTTVNVKGDIPVVKKEISLDPVSGYEKGVAQEIGKVVYYKLTASLPSEYDEYDTYYMEFVDTMSKGLTYAGIQSITLNYRDAAATDLVVAEADYPTPVVTTSGTDTVIKIAWNDIKTSFPNMVVGDHLEVVLKATVNKDAVIGEAGNPNKVQLIYSNDPNGTGKGITKEDYAIAYTFDMDVIKTVKGGEGETTSTLADAKFVLLHKHGENEVFAVVDENGKLVKWVEHHDYDACAAGTHTTATELATILTSVAGETMAVDGLTSDLQYYLREVEAPAGYNKLFSDIPLKLDAAIDGLGELTDFAYEANGVTVNPEETTGVVNTSVLVEVENSQGTKLPSTGGMGTTLFYVFGSVMVAAALVLLITKKRMTVE